MDDPTIFMQGNLSEGFIPFGPYPSFDDAAAAHDCEDGWIMALSAPKPIPALQDASQT